MRPSFANFVGWPGRCCLSPGWASAARTGNCAGSVGSPAPGVGTPSVSSRCGGCWTPKAHFAPAKAQPANRIRFKVPACSLFQPRDLQLALLRVTDPSLLITVAGLCPKLLVIRQVFPRTVPGFCMFPCVAVAPLVPAAATPGARAQPLRGQPCIAPRFWPHWTKDQSGVRRMRQHSLYT